MRIPQRLLKTNNAFLISSVILLCVLALLFQYQWIKKNQFRFGSKYGRTLINCDICKNTGLVPSAESKTQPTFCPKCLGVGGHFIKRIDDRDTICHMCGGMGRVWDEQTEDYEFCQRCGGRGLIRSKVPITQD